MKNLGKIALATALGATITTTALEAKDVQLGGGVSFNESNSKIYGIVYIDEDKRFEPFISLSYRNPDKGNSTANYEIGTSFEFVSQLKKDIQGYFGGFASFENDDNGVTTTNIFAIGPVTGIEYKFVQDFSLGAEVRVKIGVGDDMIFSTDSAIMLRYYY